MGSGTLITIILIGLLVITLPMWRYTRMWGGTYVPATVLGAALAAHVYGML
jgi:Protein of unknown function (DUF3309)